MGVTALAALIKKERKKESECDTGRTLLWLSWWRRGEREARTLQRLRKGGGQMVGGAGRGSGVRAQRRYLPKQSICQWIRRHRPPPEI